MPENHDDVHDGLKLRQIALVARELAPVEKQLTEIFGVKVAHRDPGVEKFGLENIVIPFGNQFIEVVAPTEPGTTAERYLDRRGGDGGYMAILQCENPKARDARVAALGIRTVHSIDRDDYDGLQLHPRDTGGTFLEIDWTTHFSIEDGPWYPAGQEWEQYRRTHTVKGIAAAEIQSADPRQLATRWAGILGRACHEHGDTFTIPLDTGTLRLVADHDGRGEGLCAIDILAEDPDRIWQRAEKLGCLQGPDQVAVGGVRFNLVSP